MDSDATVSAVFLLFILIVSVGAAILSLFVWGTIFRKAGYSFWMTLLMLIPPVFLIWVLIFALLYVVR